MQINRENYEAYLLDYMEGTLSPETEKDLVKFMADNPDLYYAIDLHDITVLPEKINFPYKESIKKGGLNREINRDNFEQFCIARAEGDLPSSAEKKLHLFLEKNPDCAGVANLYGNLILKADKTLIFPDKHLLKKKEPSMRQVSGYFNKRTLYRAVSVAASVVIIVSVWIFTQNGRLLNKSIYGPVTGESSLSVEKAPAVDLMERISADILQYPTGQINTDFLTANLTINNQVLPDVPDEVNQPAGIPSCSDRKSDLLPPASPRINIKGTVISSGSQSGIRQVYLAGLYRSPSSTQVRNASGPGSFINGLTGFVAQFSDNDSERERLTLWDLADAGIKGINSLAGTDLHIDREYDQYGDLVSLEFTSRNVEFQRSVTKFDD